MVNCYECSKEFIGHKELHAHLRAHKLTLPNYYHKNFPRRDFKDGELIEFKNREQYFSSFFNSQENFHSFFGSNSKLNQQTFIKEFLISRQEVKNYKYAPCQVDLRTTKQAPNIVHFRNAFLSKFYYKYCEDLGFTPKLQDFDQIKFYRETLNDLQICIDTREQKPFRFDGVTTINKKLDYGDYKFFNDNNYSVYFERKSLADLISTVTIGLDRFKNELVRAEEQSDHVIVIVESSIKDLLNFNNLKWIYSGHKITPDYVCHNIRELIQDHRNLQFVFAHSRTESVRIMKQIYCTANRYKQIDLQLAFDLGMF